MSKGYGHNNKNDDNYNRYNNKNDYNSRHNNRRHIHNMTDHCNNNINPISNYNSTTNEHIKSNQIKHDNQDTEQTVLILYIDTEKLDMTHQESEDIAAIIQNEHTVYNTNIGHVTAIVSTFIHFSEYNEITHKGLSALLIVFSCNKIYTLLSLVIGFTGYSITQFYNPMNNAQVIST